MFIGKEYTFQIYDVLDLTIELSLDGGSTYEVTPIVANLITDPEDPANQVEVGGMERILASYTWTVTNTPSTNCVVKFTDNDTGEEIVGDVFSIMKLCGATQNVFSNNIEIFDSVYGIY